MSSYILDVTNTSGDEGTIIADVGFSYSDNLNDINKGQLKISGTGVTKRSLFEIGSTVKMYRNNSLAFYGIINGISYLDGGGISADLLGYESWLAKENGAYANSPWSSTASATIASAIIAESNYFSGGTVEAGASIDFRSEATDSLYNALQRLIKRVGQDIGIDYTNSEVDILDHKGSSTSVMTLNDGIQMRDMIVRQSYPIGNDVRVFGKSEGETRIKSDNGSYGQDATSKSTYGTIRKDYIDNSVTTAGEANAMADVLVAKWKDPVKIYEFDVMNPNQALVCGDVITLNSSTKGLTAEEVRIVSIQRGFDGGNEFLTLEVSNKEYSKIATSVNQKIAELENQSKNLQTYDSFQAEYSNQNCATCIGGCSCFDGTTTYLGGMATIGTGAGGCSGDWMVFTGNISVAGGDPGILQGNYLNIGMTGCVNCVAAVLYADCFCGAGAGASDIWADGTDPYIVPCNSCGICMTGGIVSANSTNCLGCAASPGAWKEIHVLCSLPSVCLWTPSVCGTTLVRSPTVYGSTLVCGADICGTDDVMAGDLLQGTRLNVNASSACNFYVSGNGVYSGTLNITYVDGTCVCGSRKLRVPVGTNCY